MSSIFEHNTIHSFLLNELDKRKRKNLRYSIRAFARDLQISASHLSEILRGGTGISENAALEIAHHLKLNTNEKNYFLDLILATTARNKSVKKMAKDRLEKIKKLDRLKELKEAEFRVIAEWYHAALLELMEIEGFKPDIHWISRQLGISPSNVISALKKLKTLDLIIEKGNKWIPHPEAYQTFSETPSKAIQMFHEQILNKAIESIKKDPIDDREIQSMIVAIPKNHLPQFGDKMKRFMQEFWEDIKDLPKDELYSLSIQLVPVRNRTLLPFINTHKKTETETEKTTYQPKR